MLLGAARVAVGSDRMPIFLAALERLAELRPDDSDALLALGDYRALHFDEAGARALFLSARDLAADAATGAQALSRLASLALAAEHPDEAIAHLRAAIKLVDDPALYAQLGQLLFAREPADGLRMLTRAAVLAPEDAAIRLQLARALREAGDDRQRAIAEALEALRLAEDDRELAEAAQMELNALLGQ
jgi:tetratricopeptide (TPR) repeat protein